MSNIIKLLDCTLRDGAYVTESYFGTPTIRGIIKKMQDAQVDIIECGWMKDTAHKEGTSFFHYPDDIKKYLPPKNKNVSFVAMIDWDRYDVENLSEYDGKTIDAIRIVFPYGRYKEGIRVGKKIREKGYQVLFQAANTLAYSDCELLELAESMNEFKPKSVSVVDTFGAMYFDDLGHIVEILDGNLDSNIELGFHAHNNQQLAFALCIYFIEKLADSKRNIIIDSTLSGMGRGAGNATTELVSNYLNRKCHGNYDMNAVMDAIDIYMEKFRKKFSWGYSIPYFIAGIHQCHVNNINYLLKNHRTSNRDMCNIIESLSQEDRRQYDYNLLESHYMENQNRIIDDSRAIEQLRKILENRKVLLLAPGKSLDIEEEKLVVFIRNYTPVVIAVNAFNPKSQYDFIFFTNVARYEYARVAYPVQFADTKKILLSNIKTEGDFDEKIINFNLVVKRGWKHFDNAVILCLRMMNKLKVSDIYLAGFDGFKTKYSESYSDANLPALNSDDNWDKLNEEIRDMYEDFVISVHDRMKITFLTNSVYELK